MLILISAYYIAARLSLAVSVGVDHIAVWWLPNAILLTIIVLLPPLRIAGALAVCLAAHVAVETIHGMPLWLSCGHYLANLTQAITAGVALRLMGKAACFDTLGNAVVYIGIAAVAAPALAALLAAYLIHYADPSVAYLDAWKHWRMRGLTTQVTATPLLLTWLGRTTMLPAEHRRNIRIEATLLGVGVLAVSVLVFRLSSDIVSAFRAIFYAPLAMLLWAGARFGPRGAAAAIFLVSLVAVWNTVAQHGPFAGQAQPPDFVSLQFSLLFMAVPALLISSLALQSKRAAAALADNRLRLQMILDHAPFGVHTYNLGADGRLIFVGANRSAAQILNVDNRQFIGKPLEEAFPPLAATAIPEEYRRVAGTGRPYCTDQFAYEGGGVSGVFEINAIQTAPNCVSVFFRDTTERMKAEQQKAAVERQLHQAQKLDSLGKLAGGMAHDFNNLLTIMGGFTELAMTQAGANSPIAAPLREVLSAVERARDLTRRILAFSRNQLLDVRVLNLNREIEVWQQMLARLIGEHIEIALRLEGSLANIRADASQLQHVLFNLAVNARDAMPAGGRLTLETSNTRSPPPDSELPPGDYVLLCVSDTGTGMSAEALEHAFEPFFTTKPPGKGTGIGLATAFGIVRQHGGHMDLHSSPGNGAAFRIYLPACHEAECTPAPLDSTRIPAIPNTAVLVVDDETMVRELIATVLRNAGYRVSVAASAAHALQLAADQTQQLDLLLTDIVMPETNGIELHRRIREFRPRMPAVFISGYAESELFTYAGDTADITMLQKPFRTQMLLEKVRCALSQQGSRS